MGIVLLQLWTLITAAAAITAATDARNECITCMHTLKSFISREGDLAGAKIRGVLDAAQSHHQQQIQTHAETRQLIERWIATQPTTLHTLRRPVSRPPAS